MASFRSFNFRRVTVGFPLFFLKIIDRYLLAEFIKAFLSILTAFVVILMVRELLSDLAEVLAEKPQFHHVVLYFLHKMPSQIVEVTPITVLLAMMFSIGSMAKNKEVLAMHASGISYLRLVAPLAVLVALITVGVFIGNEVVVPYSEKRARFLEKVEIEGKKESTITRNKNVTTKGKGGRFYTMRGFDSKTNTMDQPTITDITDDGSSIKLRIDAESATFIPRDEEADEEGTPSQESIGGSSEADAEDGGYWRFINAVRLKFGPNRELVSREFFPVLDIAMEEDLDRFLATNKKVEEMNFLELRNFVAVQGARNKNEYYREIKTMLYNKIAFPISVFLLGMLAYSFAIRASIRSLVLEFGLALTAVVVYYMLFAASKKLGSLGVLPPFLASWYTNIIFIGFLAWRFHDLERVPRN